MTAIDVFYKDRLAGTLTRHADDSYEFQYNEGYLNAGGPAISVTLPASPAPFHTDRLFPFFDGLIPEGWLLNLASKKLRLDPLQDRYELLTSLCHDTIGDQGAALQCIDDRRGFYRFIRRRASHGYSTSTRCRTAMG